MHSSRTKYFLILNKKDSSLFLGKFGLVSNILKTFHYFFLILSLERDFFNNLCNMFLKGNATKGKTDNLMDDVSFAKPQNVF